MHFCLDQRHRKLCCVGTAEGQGGFQREGKGMGREWEGATGKPLEKETEGVCVVSSLLSVLFAFLIGKGLSWPR